MLKKILDEIFNRKGTIEIAGGLSIIWYQLWTRWSALSERSKLAIGILGGASLTGLLMTHVPVVMLLAIVTYLCGMVGGASWIWKNKATLSPRAKVAGVFGAGWGGLGFWYLLQTAGVFLPNLMVVVFVSGIALAGILMWTYGKGTPVMGLGINILAGLFFVIAGYVITKYLFWTGASGFPTLLRIVWMLLSIGMVTQGIGLVSTGFGAPSNPRTWVGCMILTLVIAGYAVLQSMNVTPFMDPVSGQPSVDAYEDIPTAGLQQAREGIARDLGLDANDKDFQQNWEKYRMAYWYLVPRDVFSMRRGFSVLGEKAVVHLDPDNNPNHELFLWLADKAGLEPNMNPEDMKARMAKAVREYYTEGKLPSLQPSVTETFFGKLKEGLLGAPSREGEVNGANTRVATPFAEILITKTPANRSYDRFRNVGIAILILIGIGIAGSSILDKGGLVFMLGLLVVCMATGVVQCTGREVLGIRSDILKPAGQQPLIGAVVAPMGRVIPIGRLNTAAFVGSPFGQMAFTVVFPAQPITRMSYWHQREHWRCRSYPDSNTCMNYAVERRVWPVPPENEDVAHEIRLDWGAGTIVWAPVCVLDDVLRKYARNPDADINARAEDARSQCAYQGGNPNFTEEDLRQAAVFSK